MEEQRSLQECSHIVQHSVTSIGGAERFAGVLPQCPALLELNLFWNQIGSARAGSFAGVLAQCPALTHLNLRYNRIDDAGAERLAGVLTQCAALAHLNLR